MKMQKLAFFRAAPAPWQATPPGGPVKKAAIAALEHFTDSINALLLSTSNICLPL